TDPKSSQFVGPLLAKRGYVVAAIDAAFSGERVGKGPAGPRPRQGGGPPGAGPFKVLPLAGPRPGGMGLPGERGPVEHPPNAPRGGRGPDRGAREGRGG